jgi:hypothetical protein
MRDRLTLITLGNLQGGAFGPVVDQAISDVLKDCDDRPSLEKARKVVIEIEFVPAADDGVRALGAVAVEASVKKSIPAQKTRTEFLGVNVVDNGDGVIGIEALLPERQDNLFTRQEGTNR